MAGNPEPLTMYYKDKVPDLQRLFGTEDVVVEADAVAIDGHRHTIRDDVILMLPERPSEAGFAPRIQDTFGREWTTYHRILPEHRPEFEAYFDLIDLPKLADAMVCDLGCGMGRHSWFLAPWCRRLVLVDFSEAIFVARRNLAEVDHAIFVMADVTRLPFADDSFDFAFSLGVLHHLPVDALDTVRALERLAPHLLIYLYYALDNRPAYFRALLRAVTAVRRRTAGIDSERARAVITQLIAYGVYGPLSRLGGAARRIGREAWVPLGEAYAGKSMPRIRQDVYDRFFTSIEQRVSREQILSLERDFSRVRIAESPPYWHFECRR
ncbi:MAG: class I SAM-dependent methyltransferase [Acidimicrobiia bacterium]